MEIEVICTGDEVLTGKTVNTNFSWITNKLETYGLVVRRGVTVGDDREELLRAFRDAGARADVVIVNGGLGPTVDDLSQEVAAEAAGVELVLNETWLARLHEMFTARGRTMTENNKIQAMLPEGAELVDNPVGTACGFGVDIGQARFYFTPGVPREMRRMVDDELLPRLLKRSGERRFIHLKRFHSYGLGESHVDEMLTGVEDMAPDGSVKLGFRTHYPQLETKLLVSAPDEPSAFERLAPLVDEVRARLGNFIIAEDDDSLEGVIHKTLSAAGQSLAVVEDFTGGQVAARLTLVPGGESVLSAGHVAPADESRARLLGGPVDADGPELAAQLARAARTAAGATFGLASVCEAVADEPTESITIAITIDSADGSATKVSRFAGARDWMRLGAVEMTLDCLRRYLEDRPLEQKNDFER
tara:strand:- start:891 stop:2141 length:1251 start_codon:yes stop_codon:yes gene_type:complete